MVNFLRYWLIYFLISLIVIGAGLFSIFKWGYNYSIDFIGGTVIEYQVKGKNYIYKSNLTEQSDQKKLIKILEKKHQEKIKIIRFEVVGPTLGRETMKKTFFASILAILGILFYMSFAFKGFNFALAAILAMIHDFLVVLGSYSLLCHFFAAEVDTLFVTAVLTTMSFSVHDTIVIFDKIREYFQKEEGNIEYFANKALTETMVRSLNNSMTIIFMLLALTLMGGSTIKFFVITLLIGTITGTYSSPFVATPILVFLEKNKKK